MPPIEYPEYSDSEILAQCHAMLTALTAAVDQLAARVEGLEAEFGPLARKYSKLTAAVGGLPGVGLGRGGRNGRTTISPGGLGTGPR